MKILLKSTTSEQFANIEQGDWIEGIGDILTIRQANFIREFGNILIKLQIENKRLKQAVNSINDKSNNIIPIPKDLIGRFYNACTEPCDMLEGPCACGAYHTVEEWLDKAYKAGEENKY